MPPRPSNEAELRRRLEDLARPAAYPHAADPVEVRQTHISCVFLAGSFAYKLKKAVDLGFLDYRRLEDRIFFSEEEIRINRRLAPEVYLGLEWVRERGGELFCFGEGEKVDVLVKMKRLPDEATFASRLGAGRLDVVDCEQLATRLVPFYQKAARGARAVENASLEVVAGNARENFASLREFVRAEPARERLEFLAARTEALLHGLGALIETRAKTVACETHGDLRLEHVYRLGAGAEGLAVIDAVEFSDRFRFADPAADLAFFVMELRRDGGAALAKVFIDRYVALSGDEELRRLIPFYVAYRALVRAKVEYLKTLEPELPPEVTAAAPGQADRHIRLAVDSLGGRGADADDGAGRFADHLLGDASDDEV